MSVVTLSATAAVDMATSYGLRELNPLIPSVALGSGRRFGRKTIVTGSAITVGSLVLQRLLARRNRRLRYVFTMFNFGYSGLHIIAVMHNRKLSQ